MVSKKCVAPLSLLMVSSSFFSEISQISAGSSNAWMSCAASVQRESDLLISRVAVAETFPPPALPWAAGFIPPAIWNMEEILEEALAAAGLAVLDLVFLALVALTSFDVGTSPSSASGTSESASVACSVASSPSCEAVWKAQTENHFENITNPCSRVIRRINLDVEGIKTFWTGNLLGYKYD